MGARDSAEVAIVAHKHAHNPCTSAVAQSTGEFQPVRPQDAHHLSQRAEKKALIFFLYYVRN